MTQVFLRRGHDPIALLKSAVTSLQLISTATGCTIANHYCSFSYIEACALL